MRTMYSLALIGVLGGCLDPGDDEELATGEAIGESSSYHPMGFARVSAAGTLVSGFNSTGLTPITAHVGVGQYTVTFPGLGLWSTAHGSGGNVQLVSEGSTTARCRIMSWTGVTDLVVQVRCNDPAQPVVPALANTPFGVLFYRRIMPAPTPGSTRTAYSYVTSTGFVANQYDYNSSGIHNSVTKTSPGVYSITIPGLSTLATSISVSAYGGPDPGATCGVGVWTATTKTVWCSDRNNNAVDSAFSLSVSTSGPPTDQQGIFAEVDLGTLTPGKTGTLGRYPGCSSVAISVTGLPSAPVIRPTGDIGSPDGTDAKHFALATPRHPLITYCKVVSLVNGGATPGAAQVKCMRGDGVEIPDPRFYFTEVIDWRTTFAPCP